MNLLICKCILPDLANLNGFGLSNLVRAEQKSRESHILSTIS